MAQRGTHTNRHGISLTESAQWGQFSENNRITETQVKKFTNNLEVYPKYKNAPTIQKFTPDEKSTNNSKFNP